MDQIVKDVINIGLGAADKVRAIVNGDRNLNITLDELKASGAANNTEVAGKIRENVDSVLAQLEELRGKVDTIVGEGQQRLNESLSSLNMPAVNVDELRANFDSYVAQVQEKLNELIEKIKPALEQANINELRGRIDEMIAKVRGGSTGTSAE